MGWGSPPTARGGHGIAPMPAVPPPMGNNMMVDDGENLLNVTPRHFHANSWADATRFAVPSRASRANITKSMAAQAFGKLIDCFSFLFDTLANHEDLLTVQWTE